LVAAVSPIYVNDVFTLRSMIKEDWWCFMSRTIKIFIFGSRRSWARLPCSPAGFRPRANLVSCWGSWPNRPDRFCLDFWRFLWSLTFWCRFGVVAWFWWESRRSDCCCCDWRSMSLIFELSIRPFTTLPLVFMASTPPSRIIAWPRLMKISRTSHRRNRLKFYLLFWHCLATPSNICNPVFLKT
jgi:hypothetical protein